MSDPNCCGDPCTCHGPVVEKWGDDQVAIFASDNEEPLVISIEDVLNLHERLGEFIKGGLPDSVD